jgi:hypothetical protein
MGMAQDTQDTKDTQAKRASLIPPWGLLVSSFPRIKKKEKSRDVSFPLSIRVVTLSYSKETCRFLKELLFLRECEESDNFGVFLPSLGIQELGFFPFFPFFPVSTPGGIMTKGDWTKCSHPTLQNVCSQGFTYSQLARINAPSHLISSIGNRGHRGRGDRRGGMDV